MISRIIPSSSEQLPVYGLGTWKVLDVDANAISPALTEVLKLMHDKGGSLIDSSPMYGNAETVIGVLTETMADRNDFFYATKVWTTGKEEGIRQMESSLQKMKRDTMDLIQIHNLTDWKTQLKTLRDWKEKGKIRYIGITHYVDSMHEELERVLSVEKVDFVQFNYSIFSRNAEKRLLNVAADLGIATLINKPFGTGADFSHVKSKQLPAWASEYGIEKWSQYFLKYIISHPAVTCVIPATSDPLHLAENIQGAAGNLPDEQTRKKMLDYLNTL